MDGVTHGSSMTQASVSSEVTFDVSTQDGVVQLLNAIRRGGIPEEEKNGLRDLVLDFAISKDQVILDEIAARLIVFGMTLTSGTQIPKSDLKTQAPIVPQTTQSSAMGRTRPAPSFGNIPTAAQPAKPVVEQRTVPVQSEIKEPVEMESTPREEIQPAEVIQPQAPAAEQRVASSIQTPPVEPSAPSTDTVARIKEIKRLVNEKVGNPVNLIDANNNVGREYMNALLNAMKLSSGGSADEIKLAMDRLEKAYQAIEETIQSGETVIHTAPSAEAPAAIAPDSDSVTLSDQTEASPVGSDVSVESAASPVIPETQSDQTPPVVSETAAPVTATPTESTPAEPKESHHSLADQIRDEAAKRDQVMAENASKVELEKAAEAKADPLMSDEITAGLHQLLSEWKLFKSSGIFGTGPSGHEHALYKAVANLPMAAVIAGRYEGASVQVKQSISDYMNGWRYEQGVVHNMGETFEHYLRRVIKVVIDRQKTKKEQQS